VHTNKPGALARKILAGLGVAERFTAILGGDDAPRKPDPTGTLEIMARVGAAPAETVFVGDSRVDVATARAAGVALVAVTWGLGARAELAAAGATVFAGDAAELARILS
jgi:phosphoglycolate phosphatase